MPGNRQLFGLPTGRLGPTDSDLQIQDDQKQESPVETVLDLRQASPVQKGGGFVRSSMSKLKGNLQGLLD